MCDRCEHLNIEVPHHICYKNHTESSTAMEADIIVEGFKTSMSSHGLIYEKLIGKLLTFEMSNFFLISKLIFVNF